VGCSRGPCPRGAELLGDAPPDGTEQWCQRRGANDQFVKHGLFREWHKNGRKKVVGQYTDGKRHGPWREWYRSGQPSLEGHYTHGEQTGRWLRWHTDGRKIGERDFAQKRPDAAPKKRPDATAADVDDPDRDWVTGKDDNCPHDANPKQEDADRDGRGDACDDDRDGDGYANEQDVCPETPNPEQTDLDGDGQGDVCDTDRDGDGVEDKSDNCPGARNADQADRDADGRGDACSHRTDLDSDGDGLPDPPAVLDAAARLCDAGQKTGCFDNCPAIPNPDQTLAACAEGADYDGDGVPDIRDNCIHVKNPDQAQTRNTTLTPDGDACHQDHDADGVRDARDNCPLAKNPDQKDANGDGVGDACTLPRP